MVFVTGGTGYLGIFVLHELVSRNISVRALYRDESKIKRIQQVFHFFHPENPALFEKIEWIKGDILDYAGLIVNLSDVDAVFHTAGYVSFDDKAKNLLNKINEQGTSNIVNACLELGDIYLCHVSSVATLGELAENIPVAEDTIWNQGTSASAYAISKFKGEMQVWRGIHEGLKAVIVNPTVIIGPYMHVGPGGGLINLAAKGQYFYPHGSAGYVDVRDVARIMVLLHEKKITGERFILNSENIDHRQILTLLAHALGKPGPYMPLNPFVARMAVSFETIRSFITGSNRRINNRTFKIAGEKIIYSNKKIRETLSVDFIPVIDSVRAAAESYIKK